MLRLVKSASLGPRQIEGFGTTTPEQLINFLRQKASRSFSYSNVRIDSRLLDQRRMELT